VVYFHCGLSVQSTSCLQVLPHGSLVDAAFDREQSNSIDGTSSHRRTPTIVVTHVGFSFTGAHAKLR
jgi:hypothetical protein